jgi:hypothetical protein
VKNKKTTLASLSKRLDKIEAHLFNVQTASKPQNFAIYDLTVSTRDFGNLQETVKYYRSFARMVYGKETYSEFGFSGDSLLSIERFQEKDRGVLGKALIGLNIMVGNNRCAIFTDDAPTLSHLPRKYLIIQVPMKQEENK